MDGSNEDPGEKKYCIIHKNKANHKTEDCFTFLKMTEKERFDRIKEEKHCYRCLEDHSRNECGSKHVCSVCKKLHHTLLHLKKEAAGSRSPKGGNRKFQNNKEATKHNKSQEEEVTEVVAVGSPDEDMDSNDEDYAVPPIMILTAVERSEEGLITKRVPFYALLDSGAEKSICTRELAMKFGKWEPNRKQRIKVLGNKII